MKQIFREQLQNEWPGLTKEVKDICKQWQIKDVTKEWEREPSKKEWKDILKDASHSQNEKSLRAKMERLSKLQEYGESEETYELKEYIKKMNMHDARIKFQLRSKMFPCKNNFKNDPENTASKWLCKVCMQVDSQSHILTCSAWKANL